MTDPFPELEQVRVSVDPQTRERHIAAMQVALEESRRPGFRGRRLLAVAVALILLLPVLSLAARDSVPGDLLYPVKLALDPLTDAVGLTAGAESLVVEVETMVDRRMDSTVIRDHAELAIDRLLAEERAIEERLALVDRLEQATDGLDGMETVRSRLDTVTDELSAGSRQGDPSAQPADDRTTTTVAPRDEEPSSDSSVTTRPGDATDTTRSRSDRP